MRYVDLNIRHCMSRWVVADSSPVFQGMLSVGRYARKATPVQSIELTDALENAAVLRIVLDLMHTKPLVEPPAAWLPLLVPVVQVLKKYDCTRTMAYYSLVLRTWAANIQVLDKLEIFSAAAHVDDVETCMLAIARGGSHNDHRQAISTHHRDLSVPAPGNSPFDMSARSVDELWQIPEAYKLALMRIQRAQGASAMHWATASQTFKDVINYSERVWASVQWQLTSRPEESEDCWLMSYCRTWGRGGGRRAKPLD